ncbi:3'-5' exonuclease [Gynuella sunshinyii]|uniref:DNA polymerase III, epsilon subunit and related 3'-5' exonuclease n=1 Tax=Gynuella sunshinyii YC6258 TaxID=1445510 RepID=A0A0C5W060_9GAMM|nr:3'-5' exonuclease [Gynuella sunshinyii]AJQ96064.1 DNA polymerase III, epsilon subunit and related 3'-5' exonuclease [Gynuella sunshinyii YC6258]
MLYLRPSQISDEPDHHARDITVRNWPELYAELAKHASSPLLKKFYSAGLPSAETPISKVPLLAMDFETTGMDAEQGDIVSIGVVPMTLERIHNRDSCHWIVRPRSRLHDDSVVIHGITHSDIAGSPDLTHYLEPLLELMAGRVMVAHYRMMERNFLYHALLRRIGEGIRFPIIDTMTLEASVNRLGFWQRLRGRKPGSLRLADARQRYHLPFYHPHHAHTDALACAELLQAQIATHFSEQTPLGELWR